MQIFATCPTGWYSDISKSIEIPRMAVQARVYPLYEIVNGKLKFTVEVNNPIPVKDYLKTQGRFKHLTEEEIAEIQKMLIPNGTN